MGFLLPEPFCWALLVLCLRLSLFIFLPARISYLVVNYHFSIHHPSFSLHPPPLHSIHPVLHSMPVLVDARSARERLSSVLAHSLSVVNEGLVLSPDPVCGSSNSFPWCRGLWIVGLFGCVSLAVIFVRPGSFLWCWYRRGFAGLGVSKEGQLCECECVFVRVRVNKNELSSACQWIPVVEALPHWTEESSYLSVPSSRHIIRYSCCVGVSVVNQVWWFRLILTSLFFSLSESPQPGWEERVHADGRTFYIDHSKDAHLLTQ